MPIVERLNFKQSTWSFHSLNKCSSSQVLRIVWLKILQWPPKRVPYLVSGIGVIPAPKFHRAAFAVRDSSGLLSKLFDPFRMITLYWTLHWSAKVQEFIGLSCIECVRITAITWSVQTPSSCILMVDMHLCWPSDQRRTVPSELAERHWVPSVLTTIHLTLSVCPDKLGRIYVTENCNLNLYNYPLVSSICCSFEDPRL